MCRRPTIPAAARCGIAVRDGDGAVSLRRRAVGREVHQLLAVGVGGGRAAAEDERFCERQRPLPRLDERAAGLPHRARHREVVVDLPHDGIGVDGGLVRDRARPQASRRTRIAQRAARLRERPRAQLADPRLGTGRLRHHERARAERGAARVGAAGVQVHGAACRARVDRERILARHERAHVRNGTRRRIDRHGFGHNRKGRACRDRSRPKGHRPSFHFSSLFGNIPVTPRAKIHLTGELSASECPDDTIIPHPAQAKTSVHRRIGADYHVAGISSTSSSTMVRFSEEKEMPISVRRFFKSAYFPA